MSTGSLAAVHLEFNYEGIRMDVADRGLILLRIIASPGEPGPDPDRQAELYPHQIVLDLSGRFFIINNLGTDLVLIIDA
ncbi:hypothetical protein S40293_10336 [Stachybotrys chartarum IBT 40293]|nr:hypothetical protein S40293_10336 [Stachybotrys chartarum IBT 40293]